LEFEGEFETHVTVRAADSAAVDALRAWASGRRLKFHHIVLDRGAIPSQPMVTRWGCGGLSGELAAAAELARQLAAEGFAVSRIKVEVPPWNRDVPMSDDEAAARHGGRYFEHHAKLILGPDADLLALAGLVQGHTAHLSRNARRVRDDGRQERFVTQRCYAAGRPTAHGRLRKLLAALDAGGYSLLEVEEEFVVHDDNPGVDAGWIGMEGMS
jgi:hypothetical protein